MSNEGDGTNGIPGGARRKTVKLGRRFAGALGTHLGANIGSQDAKRLEDEARILSLMRDVLKLAEPDPVAVNFITHAVEVHTHTYGFSQVIYDELFRLHQERLKRANPEANPIPLKKAADPRPPPMMKPRLVAAPAQPAPAPRPAAATHGPSDSAPRSGPLTVPHFRALKA